MLSEREKMLAGDSFNPLDEDLRRLREKARLACGKYNAHPSKGNLRHITRLFDGFGSVVIEPGFQCDYGINIRLGRNVFMNFNCVLLDSSMIDIGDNVLFGPAVHIYTVDHPRDSQQRQEGLCFAKPVSIGNNVWIGGGAKIFPGVTIADGVIVGANEIVRQDILSPK